MRMVGTAPPTPAAMVSIPKTPIAIARQESGLVLVSFEVKKCNA